ncbi:MAG: YgaP family membrane protein [Limnobacter sp.]|jgi:hypothetical protein|uniref:YgaP family membrane protein n=1 Tax=Limnobacter sp. TaxID=2003368 RepID=UPI0040378853
MADFANQKKSYHSAKNLKKVYKQLFLLILKIYERSGMFLDSKNVTEFLREIDMKSNVGGFDKVGRVAVGIGLIGLAASGNIGLWGYIGAVPLLTGLSGYCPLYSIFKINTCPLQVKKIK